MKVRLSATAESDLESIADWIALDNPARAVTFVRELRDRCNSLSTFPKRFEIVGRIGEVDTHKLSYRGYLVLYTCAVEHVAIQRIVNAARDLGTMLDEAIDT